MPMYEYQCQKCGLHFDVEQRMVDDPIKIHDGCGGDVVKVFSSAGIVLKGSGFYKTDARSGSSAQKAGSKKSENDKSSDSGEKKPTKTDSEAKKPSSDTKKSDSSPKSSSTPKSDK